MTECRYSEYLTVEKDYEKIYTYIEKGSKFYCHLFRCITEDETEKKLREIREKYNDSSHNCYAYVLKGSNIDIKGFSDDNEPSRTAGYPILNVIINKKMHDVLVVVTRYFGGTLLGANGLVKAYSKTATGGLDAASKVRAICCNKIDFEIEYSDFGKFENLLKKITFIVKNKEFTDKVNITGYIPINKTDKIIEVIYNELNAKVTINKHKDKKYIDFKYKGGT